MRIVDGHLFQKLTFLIEFRLFAPATDPSHAFTDGNAEKERLLRQRETGVYMVRQLVRTADVLVGKRRVKVSVTNDDVASVKVFLDAAFAVQVFRTVGSEQERHGLR